MTDGNETGRAANATQPNPTNPSYPTGGPLSRDAVWSVESLRVGNNLSITANGIQVAVCARWDVAQHICRLHNELRSQVDLFLDEPMSVGQAKVLNQMLHLCEWKP